MDKIFLNDLLNFKQDEIDNVKIKFNQYDGEDDPMTLYQNDPEIVNTRWLFWRAKRSYFCEGQVAICFLKLSDDTWLLTTIKNITQDLEVYDGIAYNGEELEKYKKYYGRVIVKYHKTLRAQGIYYKTICNQLEVNQILPVIFDGDNFPGYDKVCLSFKQLEIIVKRRKGDWVAALENQKAVYLITDTKNGKLYVGSATSDNGMLLQRWGNYVLDGHGGNKELIELVNMKGFDYVQQNFQYSILENYNSKVEDKVILQRESWWKETLQSRKFGYNSN